MQQTYVVVGGGVGGGTAALALRTGGFTGRIVLVCDEPRAPYSKPPLSKAVLRGEEPAERTALRPAKWYADKDIEVLTGVAATAIRVADRTVLLADGTLLRYDKLLLATGGRPRLLPGAHHLPGVFTLRTVEDSLALGARLRPGVRVVVIGGGFIGAEVAASAVQLGCDVTVLEGQQTPLQRVLPPQLGELYATLHRSHGVAFRTDVAVTGVVADGGALLVTAADGAGYPAEVVVVGIGMLPNTELAEQAGLLVDDGIVVDEQCRTSAPDVFAVGDVANAPNPLLGGRMRVEHWQNAQHQAKTAAANMLGGQAHFAEVPWVWSDQYDVNIQITGRPRPTDEVHLRGDVAGWAFTALLLRDGELAGAVSFNRAADVRAVRQLLTGQHTAPTDLLLDPAGDLTTLAQDLLRTTEKEQS